jgi:hypothetical protein
VYAIENNPVQTGSVLFWSLYYMNANISPFCKLGFSSIAYKGTAVIFQNIGTCLLAGAIQVE